MRAALLEDECLREHHRVVAIDRQCAAHKTDYSVVRARLHITRLDVVGDSAEGSELIENLLLTKELLALERHHRIILEKIHQLLSILIERRIVVLAELGADLCKISHIIID